MLYRQQIDWAELTRLVADNGVRIDRPRGTRHPKYLDMIYTLDYGYIPGTTGGDGEELDVFVGTAKGAGLCGVLITHDPVQDDREIKLLWDTSDEEAEAAQQLVNRGRMTGTLVRPDNSYYR